MSEIGFVIGKAIIYLIPSAILPLLNLVYKWVSDLDGVIVGVLIWVGLMFIDALYRITKIQTLWKRQIETWTSHNDFEAKLLNISNYYSKLLLNVKAPRNLFAHFLESRVTELQKLVENAADRGMLYVDKTHVASADVVLSNFEGKKEDIFRPVHFLRDNEFFFNWAREYFYKIDVLVKQKKIREVKRLVIYQNEEELDDPKSKKLMRFHSLTSGYSYKVMSMYNFKSLMRDYKLDCTGDFGIYSTYYVYRARTNILDNIQGDWLQDSTVVKDFIVFFEACWNYPHASGYSEKVSGSMTLGELFTTESNVQAEKGEANR